MRAIIFIPFFLSGSLVCSLSHWMENDYDAIRAECHSLIIRRNRLSSSLVFIVTTMFAFCCANRFRFLFRFYLFLSFHHTHTYTHTHSLIIADNKHHLSPLSDVENGFVPPRLFRRHFRNHSESSMTLISLIMNTVHTNK